MRQIKFKVFDSKEKTWIWNLGMKKNNVLCDGTEEGRFKIMQFTGLHDSNGKEMYEGDVVALKTSDNMIKYYIHYYDGEFRLIHKNGIWGRISQLIVAKIKFDLEFEVIGNIHDNPELIK